MLGLYRGDLDKGLGIKKENLEVDCDTPRSAKMGGVYIVDGISRRFLRSSFSSFFSWLDLLAVHYLSLVIIPFVPLISHPVPTSSPQLMSNSHIHHWKAQGVAFLPYYYSRSSITRGQG
jgi:hypothetical protein